MLNVGRVQIDYRSEMNVGRVQTTGQRWTLAEYRLPVSDERWQSTDYRFLLKVGRESTDYRSVMNVGRVQTTGQWWTLAEYRLQVCDERWQEYRPPFCDYKPRRAEKQFRPEGGLTYQAGSLLCWLLLVICEVCKHLRQILCVFLCTTSTGELVSVHARVCVCVFVRASVCLCVCACVRVWKWRFNIGFYVRKPVNWMRVHVV